MKTLRLAPLLLLAWMATVASYGGCDLFRPATPQGPPSGGSLVREDFSDPESTLATMQRAFAAKAPGGETYLHCMVDPNRDGRSLIVMFAQGVIIALKPNTLVWTNQQEQVFYGVLMSKLDGRDSLRLTHIDAEPDSDYTGGDSQVLVRQYELFDTPLAPGSVPIRRAFGSARLTFARVNSRWLIQKWDDRVDPSTGALPANGTDYSMSYYRLVFAGS